MTGTETPTRPLPTRDELAEAANEQTLVRMSVPGGDVRRGDVTATGSAVVKAERAKVNVTLTFDDGVTCKHRLDEEVDITRPVSTPAARVAAVEMDVARRVAVAAAEFEAARERMLERMAVNPVNALGWEGRYVVEAQETHERWAVVAKAAAKAGSWTEGLRAGLAHMEHADEYGLNMSSGMFDNAVTVSQHNARAKMRSEMRTLLSLADESAAKAKEEAR